MTASRTLAPYATDPAASRGRLHPEPESPTRTAFQRDRDRIIHSTAFRRLKHKTQVFVYHEGDHYRTRLTHSLEVAQVARSVCRCLGLDEDLAEALALAHDLGHTPFGHAGEEALDAAMAPYGGFDHNAQGLRVVTRLERRYAEFDGLNLTWETLEGLVKHNGPLVEEGAARPAAMPAAVAEYVAEHDLALHTYPGPEAQVAALADDIAYHAHDIDDGLRAALFEPADLAGVPLVGPILAEVQHRYPALDRFRLVHETVRRLIDGLVTDLLHETGHRLATSKPRDVGAIRAAGGPLVAFSAAIVDQNRALRGFLFEHMYRHARVQEMTARARRVVTDLFRLYLGAPARLPAEWSATATGASDDRAVARLVADYIAGMTDRYALQEHARHCKDVTEHQ